MKLLFQEQSYVDLDVIDTPLKSSLFSIFKHLQHVPLIFRDWDSPYYIQNLDYEEVVDRLVRYGKNLGIEINKSRCLSHEQKYFNEIHQIYEINYDGNPEWLIYHEHIHICENFFLKHPMTMILDYRDKAGLLEKPFDFSWTKTEFFSPKFKVGDVFLYWAELGKTPYAYWYDNEPNDMGRLLELAKPWLKLRPKLIVAFEDIDLLKTKDAIGFNDWWEQYQRTWCQHWKIDQWTLRDIASGYLVGKIKNMDHLMHNLKNNIYPIKLILD